MLTKSIVSDSEIHRAVLGELSWDSRVSETEVGVEVDNGVVTLTGTVSSYAKKLAAQDAAHRVSGVLDVANDIEVKIPGELSRSDTDIASAVRRTFEWDELIPHENISTTVADGWVTLEGNVPTWTARHDAEQAVKILTGVRGVSNKIIVSTPAVSPERVKQMIEDALERRAEREAERIHVSVTGGTVKLTGDVHTWHEKKAVLGAVGHAAGVRSVEDYLRISPVL